MKKCFALMVSILLGLFISMNSSGKGYITSDLGRSICDYTRTKSPPFPPGCIATVEDIEQCKQNTNCYCMIVGSHYDQSAVHRDIGDSYTKTLKYMINFSHDSKAPLVSDNFINILVKQVYFDPAFSRSGMDGSLSKQVEKSCKMNPQFFK